MANVGRGSDAPFPCLARDRISVRDLYDTNRLPQEQPLTLDHLADTASGN